jgi:hypothetical protein
MQNSEKQADSVVTAPAPAVPPTFWVSHGLYYSGWGSSEVRRWGLLVGCLCSLQAPGGSGAQKLKGMDFESLPCFEGTLFYFFQSSFQTISFVLLW